MKFRELWKEIRNGTPDAMPERSIAYDKQAAMDALLKEIDEKKHGWAESTTRIRKKLDACDS